VIGKAFQYCYRGINTLEGVYIMAFSQLKSTTSFSRVSL
jgi:hypothetical protein